jgi:hypothetical protein
MCNCACMVIKYLMCCTLYYCYRQLQVDYDNQSVYSSDSVQGWVDVSIKTGKDSITFRCMACNIIYYYSSCKKLSL